MKKFWITLLSVLTLALSVFGIVACSSSENVLSNYLLKQDGTLVDADFVLPYTVSGEEVKWTSDNAAIVVEKRTEDWLAKVNLGDQQENVKLTVSCGKETKDFNVTVAALDVSYFITKYNFKQAQSTVFADFDLDTQTTINGKTATIAWEVKGSDADYIKISEDGKKCLVTQSSLNPDVKIYATFTYNGHSQTTNYRMTVSFERDHLEEVDYWYYNTGVSIKMSGYVVAIGTAYSDQYENVTLYMVDDDFCAGYYLYRVKASKEDGALLKPGVHVTVTNTTNTNYNGLIETNAGGNLVVDTDKPEINVTDHIAAIDDDVLANSPAALYRTSTLVSLSKWKVVEKAKSKPAAGSTGTLFTIEKGGVKVAIGVSKYMEGVYATNDKDAVWNGLIALYDTINVDDVVSVSGILGNYKGYQIMPLSAENVTKETDAANDVKEACTKAAKAIKAVQNAFKNQGVTYAGTSAYTIVADKDITVPTEQDGVAITYEVLRNSTTVKVEGGTLSVTAGVEDIATVKITYTVKNGEDVVYTTTTYHNIHSVKMSPKDVVEKVKFDFEFKVTEIEDNIELPTTVSEYPGVAINWTVTSGDEIAKISNDGKKLLVTPSMQEDKDVKIVGKIVYGEAELSTKEYTIKVLKADPNKFVVTAEKLNLAAYAKEGSGIVTQVEFSWIGMGYYGDGIQMRTNDKTGTSSFWNKEALNPISKLVLTWSDTKDLPAKDKEGNWKEVLKIEFANNVEFTDAQVKTVTFADKKTLDVEIPEGSFTYVRITHNNQGAVYLKSVQINCAVPDPNNISLTSEGFNLSKYADGNAKVNGVKFVWKELGDYGDGIQMRTKKTDGAVTAQSSFWNEVALNPITKLVLTWSDSKDLPTKTDVLKIEFSNNADFTDAEEKIITFTDSKTLEVTPTGSYTYVRITHNDNGAVYLKSVQIIAGEANE